MRDLRDFGLRESPAKAGWMRGYERGFEHERVFCDMRHIQGRMGL